MLVFKEQKNQSFAGNSYNFQFHQFKFLKSLATTVHFLLSTGGLLLGW